MREPRASMQNPDPVNAALHQIGTEPEPEHTAIVLHWTTPEEGDTPIRDQVFVLRGIVEGMELMRRLQCLLQEHVGASYPVTELSVFWHHADGQWELREGVACPVHGIQWHPVA